MLKLRFMYKLFDSFRSYLFNHSSNFRLPVKMLFFLAFIIGLTACNQAPSTSEKQDQKPEVAVNKTITMDVEGMTCNGCETAIENSIKNIDGVGSVKADHKKGLAEIGYDSTKTGHSAFVTAIESSGYKYKKEEQPKP